MTRDFSQELTAYIDGELSPEARAEVEAELQRNPQLAAVEKRLRRSVEMVKALPLPAPSMNLRKAVLQEIEMPAPGERGFAWLSPRALISFGALAAAALVGIIVMKAPQQQVMGSTVPDEELLVAQQMDVLEDMEVAGLDSADDIDVIAQLNELEVQR